MRHKDNNADVAAALGFELRLPQSSSLELEKDTDAEPVQVVAKALDGGTKTFISNLEDHANHMGTSRRNLQRWLYALSEQAARNQEQTFEQVQRYCSTVVMGGEWRAELLVLHLKHDETPLRARVQYNPGDPQSNLSKMHMVEQCWGALLMRGEGRLPENVMWIRGVLAPRARVTESGAAEAVAKMLLSCGLVTEVTPRFSLQWRLVETDGLRANNRAEKVLNHHGFYKSPLWSTAHTTCAAHKCHHIACKTWSLCSDVVSGTVNSILTLQSPGAYERFKAVLVGVAAESCVIIRHQNMSERATQHRRNVLAVFCPTRKHSRAYGIVQAVSQELLNADWLDGTYVGHVCVGCCSGVADLRLKLRVWLPRLLGALSLKTLCKANWQSWQQSMNFVGYLSQVHDLWQRSFIKAFGYRFLQEIGAEPLPGHADPVMVDDREAEPLTEADEKLIQWRQEMTKRVKAALHFWYETASPAASLYTLRLLLEPQRIMMGKLLHMASSHWHLEQLEEMRHQGQNLESQMLCVSPARCRFSWAGLSASNLPLPKLLLPRCKLRQSAFQIVQNRGRMALRLALL